MVLAQKWPFSHLFWEGNIGQENVFYDVLEKKNAFLAYKKKKLVYCFEPKLAIFPSYCFRQYRPGKCVFMIILEKKPVFRLFKKQVQKDEILTFFKSY